jgi:hypothetical protein
MTYQSRFANTCSFEKLPKTLKKLQRFNGINFSFLIKMFVFFPPMKHPTSSPPQHRQAEFFEI